MRPEGGLLDPRTLRLRQLIGGPAEHVWRFLTDPTLLASWLGPCTIDPVQGGEFRFHPPDASGAPSAEWATGHISECRPPWALEVVWNDPTFGGGRLRFDLAPAGQATWLTLTLSRTDSPFTAPAVGALASLLALLAARGSSPGSPPGSVGLTASPPPSPSAPATTIGVPARPARRRRAAAVAAIVAVCLVVLLVVAAWQLGWLGHPTPATTAPPGNLTYDQALNVSNAYAADEPGAPWGMHFANAVDVPSPATLPSLSLLDGCVQPSGATGVVPQDLASVSAGTSPFWVFEYGNQTEAALLVQVDNGTASTYATGAAGTVCGSDYSTGTDVPAGVLNSPQAVADADGPGGLAAFLQTNPESQVTIEVATVTSPRGPPESFWGFLASPCLFGPRPGVSGTQPELSVTVNGTDGHVDAAVPSSGSCTNGVGQVMASVDTPASGISDYGSIEDPGYPTCTGANSACFTSDVDGSCSFDVNEPSGGYPLVVQVLTGFNRPLPGATVTLTAVGVSITVAPSATLTTDQNGQALFTALSGTVPANDPSGGSIAVSATYTSGGISTSGSATISIEPPTENTSTDQPVSC